MRRKLLSQSIKRNWKRYEKGQSSMTQETKTIDDILKLQAEAFKQHKEQVKEMLDNFKEHIALMGEERKEWRAGRELQEEMVKEYDRWTQRVSLQLKALIAITERLEQVN